MKVKKIRPESKSSLKTAVKNVQSILKKKKKSKKLTENEDTLETPKRKIIDSTENLPEVELQYNSKAGVIYIGQIPHGFYEDEMKDFFSQFGKVHRVRLVRSKKTGKSRGYGYVEFQTPEVAKIAAETMNNYVMCGRLLRVTYIPPEKQHFGFFFGKKITPNSYPRLENRNKIIKSNHAPITETKHKKCVKTSLKRLSTLEKKLKMKGIIEITEQAYARRHGIEDDQVTCWRPRTKTIVMTLVGIIICSFIIYWFVSSIIHSYKENSKGTRSRISRSIITGMNL